MIEFTENEVLTYAQYRLTGLKQNGPKELRGPCPVHQGKDPNFTLEIATGLSHCFSSCQKRWDLLGLEMALSGLDFVRAKQEVFRIVGKQMPDYREKDVEAYYSYTDENGKVLYQVLRKLGKKFMQRKPDGKGGWVWNLGGITPVPFQLHKWANLGPDIVIPICYASDTDLLTKRGWIAFPELTTEDCVAQYSESGSIRFVRPSAYQKFEYNGEMVDFSCDWSGMLVTPEHRVLSRCKMNNGRMTSPVVRSAVDVTKGRFLPVAGHLTQEQQELGLGEVATRLMVAWCADGVDEKRGFKISWNIKKERKKKRLRDLLLSAGIEFTEHQYPSAPGWTLFRAQRSALDLILGQWNGKQLPMDAMYWSENSRVALLEELGYWDGDRVGKEGIRFFTANRCEADVVSAISAVTGYGCIIRSDDRPSRPEQRTQYVVSIVPREWRMRAYATGRSSYNGHVHCCTVPSGFLVTRRNGKTTIAGNCEGERDALSLTRGNWVATCNNGGAGNFKPELAQWFKGRHVAIFPDNDEPGRKHAQQVATLLHPVAASVRVVELPGMDLKGDVSDFLAKGGTVEDLYELYDKSTNWTPEWRFATDVPHENDKYVHTLSQVIERCGGEAAFWKTLDVVGIPTPFPILTEGLRGLRNGEVYCLGANRGMGKSSLALQFALTAMEHRFGVLLFSMEMHEVDVLQRVIAIDAKVDLLRMGKLRKYGDDDALLAKLESDLRRSTQKIKGYPLTVITKSRVTPQYLADESKRIKDRGNIKMVIVDHMQLMESTSGKERSDYEKFTSISRTTKGIAMELGVPLILISQTSRNNSRDKRNELEISDLRGSGALEEDAAAVLLLYYDQADYKAAKDEPNHDRLKRGPIKAWLKTGKNRFGPEGFIPLDHFRGETRFALAEGGR